MKHRITFLFAMLLIAVAALGAQVSKEDARSKAEQFMALRHASARGTVRADRVTMVLDASAYYIFNVGTADGFVIVSGDDRAPAILGYSDSGSFDAQSMPENMRAFLQGYADEIQHLPESASAASRGVGQKRVVRSSISPLLTTLWKQGAPYNSQCPIVGGKNAVTGCVATAMAQVMNYHQYPIGQTTAVGGLSATRFDWNQMLDSYAATDDGNEVAKLMHYCGVSVDMSYGASSSGAVTSKTVTALINYFDYDAGARYVMRSSYGYVDWVTLLYSELAQQRPVIMGGQSTGGGHAFVCDGYDEDDFFHINWGWGGMSNGYFRLSNLAPDNQGTGGSTTSDGYNLELGAAIGVQPNKGTPSAAQLLTVRDMQFYDSSATSLTYHRTSTSTHFYDPILTCEFWNFTGSTSTFDYGVRVKRDGLTVLEETWSDGSTSIEHNKAKIPGRSFWFGEGLENGTYQIVGICRLQGQEMWTECVDADKYYIEATIDDLTLTMNVIKPADSQLSVTSVTGTTGLSYYIPQDVTVTLANSGAGDFRGDITLELINGNAVYQKLGGAVVDIPAGESRNVTINVCPTRTGTYNLAVVQGFFLDGTIIDQRSVTIASASGNASVSMSNFTTNDTNGHIYGNTFKANITAQNTGGSDYKYGFTAELYKVTNGNSGTLAYEKTDNTVLAAGATRTYSFEFPDLEYGEEYFCYVGYYTFSGNTRTFESTGGYSYDIVHGFVTMDAEGHVTAAAPTASVTVPTAATTVDLRGQDVVTSVTPNTNTNCIYLLDAEAVVPAGLDGKNVVKGSVASSITLADGSDFVTPESFTATTASYSRTFTTGTNGTGGWMTLVVPFDVDQVTVDGVEKQWFHSSTDTGKHFWVKKFVSDGLGTVSFDYTDKIEANTPYIIAVPDATWGTAWDLRGKTLVFTGANKTVSAEKAVMSGDNYRFTGTTKSVSLSDIYALNAAGTSFKLGNTTVSPFQAYFVAASLLSATASLNITSPSDQTTGVNGLPAEIETPAVYSLDGRRVPTGGMKKGVYIVNGKKVIQ